MFNLKCDLDYHPDFLTIQQAESLYQCLIDHYPITKPFTSTSRFDEETASFGKAMFIDQNLYDNGSFPEAAWGFSAPWFDELFDLKKRVETASSCAFHTCVCIYYPDGNTGVDFHSDFVAFGTTEVIASISLGAKRSFQLREKASAQIHDTRLGNGSLLVMGKDCQDLYEHALPVDPACSKPRINLTFRTFGYDNRLQ